MDYLSCCDAIRILSLADRRRKAIRNARAHLLRQVWELPVTSRDYHIATTAWWTPCDPPQQQPPYWRSEGSDYWIVGNDVIRCSDHWGCVGSCLWLLEGETSGDRGEFWGPGRRTGRCAIADFRRLVPNAMWQFPDHAR